MIYRFIKNVFVQVRFNNGLLGLTKKIYFKLRKDGFKDTFKIIKNFYIASFLGEDYYKRTDYKKWIALYDCLDNGERSKIKIYSDSLAYRPFFSIILPVYNSDICFLREAINSVFAQIYPEWELCIADDASTDIEVKEYLKSLSISDKRIKVVFRESNGHISEASNTALKLSKGEWLVFMDHDDLLAEDALHCIADVINKNKSLNLIYTDEDKIDEKGNRFSPHFKPDWNPDLFLSHNYISHLTAVRKKYVDSVGGFKKGVEGSQDYDLLLRVLEKLKDNEIYHIPKILYHWRAIQGSTALATTEKSYTAEAGLLALKAHFERCSIPAVVSHGLWANTFRVQYPLPKLEPLVTIIIPTKDQIELLKNCINSIFEKTIYNNYEVIVVNNNSKDPEILKYFEELKDIDVKVLDYPYEFNYSAINNYAARHANGELLAFLNNDVEVISGCWLSEMASQAMRADIGCVGAKLHYADMTIQHAGVVLGMGGCAGHAHKLFNGDHPGYFCRLLSVQNFSAITAAALVLKKRIFFSVEGFDEVNLVVAYNDVDLCLKVMEAGYRNLWTPYASLYHHESKSRGEDNTPEKATRFNRERDFLTKKWVDLIDADPYYNPNLTVNYEDFSLAWPPRIDRFGKSKIG